MAYQCPVCGQKYTRERNLKKHVCLKCEKCLQVFSKSEYLIKHKCRQDYICPNCRRSFSSTNRLLLHSCSFCSNCQKVFSTYQKYQMHATLCLKKPQKDATDNDIGITTKKINDIKKETKCVQTKAEFPQTGLQITNIVKREIFHFRPVDLQWQIKLTNEMNLDCVKTHSFRSSIKEIKAPSAVYQTEGDGNCFFRSLAYILTGNQDTHFEIRQLVVSHMLEIPDLMAKVLPGDCTIHEYLHNSNMASNYIWATTVEIFAAAHLLKTDIYVYSRTSSFWNWLKHSGKFLDPAMNTDSKAIYLQHTGQNHFDVVTCTKDLDNAGASSQSCSEFSSILISEIQKQSKGKWEKSSNKHSDMETIPVQQYLLTQEQIQQKRREKNRERKRLSRKTMSASRKEVEAQAAKVGMKLLRNKRGADKIEQDLVKKREHMKALRQNMSHEDYEHEKEANRIRISNLRAKMSLNQVEKELMTETKRIKVLRSKRTLDKIEKDLLKQRKRMRLFRLQLSSDDKNKERMNNKLRVRSVRSKMSLGQLQQELLEQRRRMKAMRDSRTFAQKKHDKDYDRIRIKLLRSAQTSDRIEKALIDQRKRMKDFRHRCSATRKKQERAATQIRVRLIRSKRTSDELDHDLIVDKVRKKNQRKCMTLKQKKYQVKLSKNRMKLFRLRMSESRKVEYLEQQQVKRKLLKDTATIQTAMKSFKNHIKESPEYICTVCHRSLYRNSMVKMKNTFTESDILAKCGAKEKSYDGLEYICRTCQGYLKSNRMPPQAVANNMYVPAPVPLIASLTPFEARLLSKRYPFMKLMALPKGRQTGIVGAVVNVPIDVDEVCQCLPHTPLSAGIIAVKLKRKQSYKGYAFYENIRPSVILEALQWLKSNNHHYAEIAENDNWEQKCKDENQELWGYLINNQESNKQVSETADVQSLEQSDLKHDITREDNIDERIEENDLKHCSTREDHDVDEQMNQTEIETKTKLRGLQLDSCIQRTDPLLDSDNILNLGPGEGKRPIGIMLDKGCEEQAFPQLFPTGKFGFDADRQIKLTPKKYFNARILNKSGNFAKNIEYLFFAQYVTEHKQIMDCVSVAVRKSYNKSELGHVVNVAMLKDPDKLQSLLLKDKAYQFLQSVRGTPPYWQNAMYKLLAAIKQFGIFTFFMTLSSADLKWHDTIEVILKQQGRPLQTDEIDNLTWEEKCGILRSNPVTAARHFDHRLQCFFKDIILSPAEPLGKVTHFSYRIEFQQRGSPHAHCVLWVADAPTAKSPAKEVCNFINKYITCSIPEENKDPELYSLVTTVQRHSHSTSCKKKGNNCRFNFPKPPSEETLISQPLDSDNPVLVATALENASDIKTAVYEQLESTTVFDTIEDLLNAAGVTMEQYMAALRLSKRGRNVILRRTTAEKNINCYNRNLLLSWEANIDVQFCHDPYGCIAYMVGYITKDEREMSQHLQAVAESVPQTDIRTAMKRCASAFLNAREVSAQEAVYRLLSFPMFNSNFEDVFIPTGLPEKRISLLKPQSVLDKMDDTDEDVFQTTILDRYAARPDSLESVCLAQFAAWYTYAQAQNSKMNVKKGIITLKKDMGYMKKRKKAAVIRYHKKYQKQRNQKSLLIHSFYCMSLGGMKKLN